jgi:hypothetical protein
VVRTGDAPGGLTETVQAKEGISAGISLEDWGVRERERVDDGGWGGDGGWRAREVLVVQFCELD